MKKLLSLVLSLFMVCMLPIGVFAEDDILEPDESPEVFWRGEYGEGSCEHWGDFTVYVQENRTILLSYAGTDADVVIPKGVNFVSELLSWKDRSSTVTLTFPEGMTATGYYCFRDMTRLKEVRLPEGLKAISEGSFMDCSALEKIHVPDTVTEIGYSAFLGCTSLQQIELPEGLEFISSGAFYNTGLTEITIPSTVVWVSQPFFRCEKLKKIVVASSETKLQRFTKDNIGSAVIYEPKGSKAESSAKKADIPFKAFALNKTTLSLSKGKTCQLQFNVGSDATWKSSNSKVVSVSKTGKLTAKANGTATITATLYGKKYTCKVTVGTKTYTVKRGDTLWSIAAKQLGNGRRYTEIMKLNGLKSTKIVSGQKLKLPER